MSPMRSFDPRAVGALECRAWEGYAVLGVLAFLFVKALVPETKGRSLEEIEADLQRKTRHDEPARAGGSGRFERGQAGEERATREERTVR